MNILGITKGTELEKEIDQLWKGEAQGAKMYASLAFLAKEKGLEEVSKKLTEIASDELRHAGLYATLNGHTNEHIFEVLEKAAPAESAGVTKLQQFAAHVKDLGFKEAALHIERAALDEGRHGEILKRLVETFGTKDR